MYVTIDSIKDFILNNKIKIDFIAIKSKLFNKEAEMIHTKNKEREFSFCINKILNTPYTYYDKLNEQVVLRYRDYEMLDFFISKFACCIDLIQKKKCMNLLQTEKLLNGLVSNESSFKLENFYFISKITIKDKELTMLIGVLNK